MHKRFIQSAIGQLGFSLQRLSPDAPPIDLRDGSNDPREMMYLGNYRPVLINVPMNLGRRRWFSLGSDTYFPFAVAVKQALKSGNNIETVSDVLATFAQLVQPHDALEAFGFDEHEAPQLKLQPPTAANLLPWMNYTNVDKFVHTRRERDKHKNRLVGLSQFLPQPGDLSAIRSEEIHQEAERIFGLALSIQENGYQRHDGHEGDITGMVLYANGEWRWVVYAGQHRAGVLAALGKTEIPLRVIGMVNRDDADIWPTVRSGVYSKEGALKAFDRVFNAVLPPCFKEWQKFVQRNYQAEVQPAESGSDEVPLSMRS